MPQDLKKSQIYASKKICFESEEVNQIKLFDKQGEEIRLTDDNMEYNIWKKIHRRQTIRTIS